MRYTLMNKDHEVLDFLYDPASGVPEDVRPCEDFAWAPVGMPDDVNDLAPSLKRFLEQRAIYCHRLDSSAILRACGARSTVDLALKSGGFSLSDQYWYRSAGSARMWSSSNYFENDWDPTFGEAMLRKDYGALAKASIHTPDVTLSGFCRKAWVQTEIGPHLYKATPTKDDTNIYCEALVSRMLDRLVGRDGHVHYEPAKLDGELFSTCPLAFGTNDELLNGFQLYASSGVDTSTIDAQTGLEDFDRYVSLFLKALDENGIRNGHQAFTQLFVMATLALDFDTHPSNFGVIRDVGTLELRAAPLYDFGRGFTYMRSRYGVIRREPKAAGLLLAIFFSRLEPTWDYSWYDPHALDGFEEDILETLSAIDALPMGYAEMMATLFLKQRDYVDSVVRESLRDFYTSSTSKNIW